MGAGWPIVMVMCVGGRSCSHSNVCGQGGHVVICVWAGLSCSHGNVCGQGGPVVGRMVVLLSLEQS